MSREATVSATQMVARSLKISAATHLVVASVAVGVAVNAAVAMQFLGVTGQAVLLAIVFASLAAGGAAVSVDVYSRSAQVVSNLRSIGASSGSVSSAVVLSLIGYGAGGSALGGVLGTTLGAALGGAGILGETLLVHMVAVVFAACTGLSAGIFFGARASWHR
ncbi:MAG: hypothetical protein JRN06_02890 [Nitrososphaerota archaeon]|nr:hypothetical protein [Nitrososphaerota archaeon]MDG7023196.1 hypothetical protein [Nitrososphaerota archaeon]